ncbi:MAG: DUF3990 domain-containing protein [Eubacterium sp.]|nr:DUF3990 domain-containing protein [Eubacterium sp.]
MSIQSDVELLSVRAMEEYAKRNYLSTLSAIELFHHYQVFEKIMLQHEYLHQVDFEEVMEYVEKVIQDDLHKLSVFHGTIARFEKVELTRSHNRRDFGMGFYTTILESQAKEWAYRLRLREKADEYFVNQYSFEEDSSLNIKRFDGLNLEWLEFIKENRSKGGLQHKYDVVIGPVADDNTMETVLLYMNGILSGNEAVERLRYNQVNNQISFHTERALESLKFVRRERYE